MLLKPSIRFISETDTLLASDKIITNYLRDILRPLEECIDILENFS